MASAFAVGHRECLNGTIALPTWLSPGAQCCSYRTFIIDSKEKHLVVFGHPDSCNETKGRIYVNAEDFFRIYPDDPFPGMYPVTETLAIPPFDGWHKPRYDRGRKIFWHVGFENIRHLLKKYEVEKYYKQGPWVDDNAYGTNGIKDVAGVAGFCTQNGDEKKADGNRGARWGLRGGSTLNADGEGLSGSGSRPRRMTRGQDELHPQIQAFSAANKERAPGAQPSQRVTIGNTGAAGSKQPLQICPCHGADRCDVDGPNWLHRRESLFDLDSRLADSCLESTNRESPEPELRVRHHRRGYLNLKRATNYRPAQVELHQSNGEKGADKENQNVGLRGGALPGPSSESDASSTHTAIKISDIPTIDMSTYAEEMGYIPWSDASWARRQDGLNEQHSQAVMTEANRWKLVNGADYNDGSCIVIPEKCRCILRMVKDYGHPLQDVPTIWKTYCLEHNPDVSGRQPWQVYGQMHGSAPPPYQKTTIADPEDPRPPKAESTMEKATMGLRGGAQPKSDTEANMSEDSDDWETTSGSDSDYDDEPAETNAQRGDCGPKIERPVSDNARADEACAKTAQQDSKVGKYSFVGCTHKHAHDMCAVAEELQKLNFGSDAPMDFGNCSITSEADNSPARAASARAIPSAPKVNMGLKGGAPPRGNRGRANASRPIRHRRQRTTADRMARYGQASQVSRQDFEDMRRRILFLEADSKRAEETINKLQNKVEMFAVANSKLRQKAEDERGCRETIQQQYDRLAEFNADLGNRMMEQTQRLTGLYQERSQARNDAQDYAYRQQQYGPHVHHGMPPVCTPYPRCFRGHYHEHYEANAPVFYDMYAPPAEQSYSYGQPRPNVPAYPAPTVHSMTYTVCGCNPTAGFPIQHADNRLAMSEQHPPDSSAIPMVRAVFRAGPSSTFLQNGGPSPEQFRSTRHTRREGEPKTVGAQGEAFNETPINEWWKNLRPLDEKAKEDPVPSHEQNQYQEVEHEPKHKKKYMTV